MLWLTTLALANCIISHRQSACIDADTCFKTLKYFSGGRLGIIAGASLAKTGKRAAAEEKYVLSVCI